MLLMPAGTYVRFLPLVAAFDPAHEASEKDQSGQERNQQVRHVKN